MELDEMKKAWQELSSRNAELTAQVSGIETELKRGRSRSQLMRFAWVPAIEVVTGFATPLLVGSFLADGPYEAKFVLPALVLMAAGIVLLASSIWQLATIGQIDFRQPVIEVQRRIAAVQLVRIRTTQWTLILSPAFWMPLFTVALRGLIGLDVYRVFGTTYVLANLLFGLAAAPAIYFIARAVGRRFRGSSTLRYLVDDIGGRSLSAAVRSLDETVRFGAEG